MNQIKFSFSFLLFLLLFSISVSAQDNAGTSTNNDIVFELRNDTLFSNSGVKIFVGQKLVLGNGAGQNGYYRSIISDYAAIVPRIWGKNKNVENDIENYVDTKKGRKQIKELMQGQYFTIKKITLHGNKKKYHFYLAWLSSDTNNYKCDIALALKLKECLL